MTFTYPITDLERPKVLLDLLGSFWASTYGGSHDVESYLSSRAQLEKQTVQNLREAIDATSRLKVPVYHTALWYQLILKESEMNDLDFSIPKYGEEFLYGPQPITEETILYGEPTNRNVFAFKVPVGLAVIPGIYNRTDSPTISWLNGLEYEIEEGYLKLINNPFDTSGLAVRDVVTDGEVTDREVALWLFNSQWDVDMIWVHYGHILGIDLPSSRSYKNLVNSVFDAIVEGSSIGSVSNVIAAVADVPTIIEDDEVVEAIIRDQDSLTIVTDKNSYIHGATATAAVAVGDEVHKGQLLCLAAQTYSPGHEEKPSWLSGLCMEESYIDRFFRGGILFIDDDLPLVVTTEDGRTRADLTLHGDPITVDMFLDEIHFRGLHSGETLANLLDIRETPSGDPTAASLPSTVNPLKFLLDNILRNNALIVLLRPSEFGPNALPVQSLSALRRILPPQRTVIIVVQAEAIEDSEIESGSDNLAKVQWMTEIDEDSAIEAGSGNLDPAGYTNTICW
jgi:hypothetical protein